MSVSYAPTQAPKNRQSGLLSGVWLSNDDQICTATMAVTQAFMACILCQHCDHNAKTTHAMVPVDVAITSIWALGHLTSKLK